MYIKTLNLKNFRNYSEETFEFSNGINLLTGANAQGKTNARHALQRAFRDDAHRAAVEGIDR